VQVAFSAIMIALLIVGIVAYRSVLASFESAQWAQHTNEVLEHLANLRLGVESIEDGYRDFALSGADAYLQRSRAGTALADDEQRALLALTADNPRQQRRLSIIAELRQGMVQHGDTIAGLRRSPTAEDEAALSRGGQEDSLLDAFRVAARDMEVEEQRLLRERNSAAVNRFRQTQVASIVGSTLALLIAALSGWRVARDRTVRKGAEEKLKRLNRLYAMVTGINALMVRVRGRTDLFNGSCQIAVEHGEFEMA
jgi:CHASE3 domain sensor protein